MENYIQKDDKSINMTIEVLLVNPYVMCEMLKPIT